MIESKKRALIFLLLAFILAVAVGYLVFEKVKELNEELGGMTEVYIANGAIYPRQMIHESQVTVTSIPNKFVTDSYITDKTELVNKISLVKLNKGDLITESVLKDYTPREENVRIVDITANSRIKFNQVVDLFDRVDIIVSKEINGDRKTEIFMRNLPVLHSDAEGNFVSQIGVAITLSEASKLIHQLHYAEHVNILLANAGNNNPVQKSENTNENEQDTNQETESTEQEKQEQEELEQEEQSEQGES